MGPVLLPFNGTDNGFNLENDPVKYIPVLKPSAGGTQADTILYVGVIFNVPLGNGLVKLGVPKLDGGTEEVEFSQATNLSRMIAVPFTEDGVWLHTVSRRAKGDIIIATST